MSRRSRRGLILILTSLWLNACSGSDRDSEASVGDVVTSYEDIAPPGFIDQTVEFSNRTNVAIAVTAEFTALDIEGEPVPGITVATAFGSDRGLLVVPPAGFYDILTFDGERVRDVTDVDIDVTAMRNVEGFALVGEVEPIPISDGVEVTKFDVFSDIRVQNPSSSDIAVRIVCIDYDSPDPGEAQQAVEIIEVVDLISLPPKSTESVSVSSQFADRTAQLGFGCSSLKAHPTAPSDS